MKRILLVLLTTIAMPVMATSAPPSSISISKQKSTMNLSPPPQYEDIRSQVYQEQEYGFHDDSSGAGGGDESPTKILSSNDQINKELDPINCTHPAYISLCNEIKLYSKNAADTGDAAKIASCNAAAHRFTGTYQSSGCSASYYNTYKVYDDFYWSTTTNSCQVTPYLQYYSQGYCGSTSTDTQYLGREDRNRP